MRFASGSLAQFLDITYSEKLTSSSTLDDVRGTLENFIPGDYYRTEAEFLARVEEDASSFRPPGVKIHSYTRAAPHSSAKGKGAAATLSEDDPDAVVYEVWHVRRVILVPTERSFDVSPGNMEYPRISRISPADANIHLALYRSWFLHQRGGRRMGVCRFVRVPSSSGSSPHVCPFPNGSDKIRYEKRKRRTTPVTESYHFVGYSSLHPFYCYPDKVRLRLRYA